MIEFCPCSAMILTSPLEDSFKVRNRPSASAPDQILSTRRFGAFRRTNHKVERIALIAFAVEDLTRASLCPVQSQIQVMNWKTQVADQSRCRSVLKPDQILTEW